MAQTATVAIKEWRKNNKLICQIKLKYKKVLRKCREIPLAGGKYKEYQELCDKYVCARLTGATQGLVSFQDKPFKAYLNKKMSRRAKLDIAHGALIFIEKTFSADALPQLYNVVEYGLTVAEIPLKNGSHIAVKLLASPFQEEGELMLLMLQDGKRIYSICFSCTEDGRAYIGGIQGGKDIANDEIKVLTKELHGTRPKNLIISLLYGFLQHSDIKEIYAIDSDFHVKSEKVQTSYSALWLEVGGEKHRRGWYKLPPQEIKKSIEEVKSKHRSQFIKREGLKELAQLEMKAALRQISGSRPVN
ncbi:MULTISPECIES: DUF535 family protein [Raoultella]|jgi:uncharacterized protein VirK/YbjX|uniref:DUF535 domain-containing protein n=1 Tax=Raoultella planticola TaxID=575 RepID=A0A2X2EGB8_RAOPL|nr:MULTISPECIES: DUF535 family protein [Raoultella]MDU4421108.1 DUF535 family protein [Raoultella sp.]ATM05176.1 DUF535 domain-containing protein [Raoultella planticola]ATM17618.1 DUF535 domain-containing protein [Raoultella planticola]AUU06592.1 DUF535 domain-containing protein [Raoultella planticola]AUV53308.1 hypothetical protein B1209_11300 [Raoultella planticola]